MLFFSFPLQRTYDGCVTSLNAYAWGGCFLCCRSRGWVSAVFTSPSCCRGNRQDLAVKVSRVSCRKPWKWRATIKQKRKYIWLCEQGHFKFYLTATSPLGERWLERKYRRKYFLQSQKWLQWKFLCKVVRGVDNFFLIDWSISIACVTCRIFTYTFSYIYSSFNFK